MKDTRLYIADELVDLDADSIITMNYLLEDSNNPTIVKNSFSKSITLPATANNNALFGHIYDLTRKTIIDADKQAGVNFNSLKRTPFKLFIDSALVESGYIQLIGINKTNGTPRYTIQAFGGLGDFFYNLMYDENGDKRNLASLNFGFENYDGDAVNEMDFTIDKGVVANAWASIPRDTRHDLTNAITFVPAYNGVSRDFDASHALVNYANNADMALPNDITSENKTYSPHNGYGLMEFKRPMDETEVRDLRSYLQRPALSVRSLFTACSKSENNGGYDVTLDNSFFNEDNPLYHDAYITLPMLGVEVEQTSMSRALLYTAGGIGGNENSFSTDINLGYVRIGDSPTNSTIAITVPVTLSAIMSEVNRNELFTDIDVLKFYEDANTIGGVGLGGYYDIHQTINSAIVAQLVVYDANEGALLGASAEVAFSNKGQFDRTWGVYSSFDKVDRGVVNHIGSFTQSGDTLTFTTEDGHNTFPVSMSFVRNQSSTVQVVMRVQRVYKKNYENVSNDASILFADKVVNTRDGVLPASMVISGNALTAHLGGGTVEIVTTNLPSISSGSKVTKDILLGSTASPADYILSYCKLFNLHFIKDVAAKSITITPNYFIGEVVNIHDRIDREQTMTITPNVFSTKFHRMALSQPKTYFSEKYSQANKLDYGQKRVDTGFAFNNETEDVYKGNVFTSAVPCLAVSSYYNTYRNSDGVEVFTPIADNPTLSLFHDDSANGITSANTTLSSATYIAPLSTTPFNVNKGYDIMPRMCYFNQKNDEQRESVDISNNLVIFNNKQELRNSAGEEVEYWLTDDVPEMVTLNDGKNCYLLTKSATDRLGNTIALRYTSLPMFLSVKVANNNVVASFDFAKSKESYIPSLSYPEEATIYERYWSKFYNDRMDVDTRKVSCMVDLAGMRIDGESLRKLYSFDNCVWLLSAIEDYDPTTDRLTRCEFVKVKNIDTYINSVSEEVVSAIEEE
jgi:hypothetical protein